MKLYIALSNNVLHDCIIITNELLILNFIFISTEWPISQSHLSSSNNDLTNGK